MNDARRKQIQALKERLQICMGEASSIADELAALRDEEQEYYDNMPEGLQNSERGDRAQQAVDAMENVIGWIEDFSGADSDELDTATE